MTDNTDSTLQQCISCNFLTYSISKRYYRAATKVVGDSQLVAAVCGKQQVLVSK